MNDARDTYSSADNTFSLLDETCRALRSRKACGAYVMQLPLATVESLVERWKDLKNPAPRTADDEPRRP